MIPAKYVQPKSMDNSSLQIMDLTTLKAVLADLRTKIVPSRFEKAQQLDKNTLQIAFRTVKQLIWIELSWDADSARLVEIPPPPKPSGESTLAKQINFGLRRMALIELKQESFERVIEFKFSFRPNQSPEKFLILELMGRHSNFLMLNKQKEAITLGRQIRNHQSRLRPLSTGDLYTPPPKLNGAKPQKEESFQDWKKKLSLVPISFQKALLQNFQGISPSLTLQLADDKKETANHIANLSIQEIPEVKLKEIYQRWLIWLKHLEAENFCICFDGPTPYRVWKANNFDFGLNKDISITIGNYYQIKLNQKKFKALANGLRKELIKIKKYNKKLKEENESLINKIPESDLIQNKADEILCAKNLNKEKIREAQLLYKKAKKMRRSKTALIKRLNYHNERLNLINESELFLNEIVTDILKDPAEQINTIHELKAELDCHLFQNTKSTKNHKTKLKQSSILELTCPSGLAIQIGRNHRQNELISIKNARNGDIWFHAQECPGSHVVIKASNGISEEEDFQIAVDLAAFFSKAKSNKKVPVIMVPTNQLQRLKGAIPGTVSHRGGKVLWGDPAKGKAYFEKAASKAQNALSS